MANCKHINECLLYIKSLLDENEITCEFNIDKDVELFASKNEFKQALLNILDNSIHALKINTIVARRY